MGPGSMRSLWIILAGAGVALTTWLFLGVPERSIDMNALTGDVGRGAYMVRLAGCITCHTRPKGGTELAGGGPLVTNFGTFYGPNITSDPAEGIGHWTGEAFAGALVNGHSAMTGHLYPVFPYTSYAKMTSQDVADLWAFMQTVPADQTPSKPHEISNPFLSRVLLAPWKTLFHDVKPLDTVPGRSEQWNRGRYIVEGPGHCTECHTPRGPLGALAKNKHLTGATLPPKGEKVPDITTEALEKRGYAQGDLLMAFQFGLMPDGDVLGGSMGEVLTGQLEHLSMEDLEAIATYLLGGDLQ